jgi:hypothetical protein
VDCLQSLEDSLDAVRDDFRAALEDLVADWPNVVERAKEWRNGLFDARDYPASGEAVRELYDIDVSVRPVPDAGDLAKVFGEAESEVRRRCELELDELQEQARAEAYRRLYDRLQEPLRQALEKCRDLLAGKASRVYPSLVGNIADACDVVSALNFDGDVALGRAVEAVRAVASETSVADIKRNKKQPEAVKSAREALAGRLEDALQRVEAERNEVVAEPVETDASVSLADLMAMTVGGEQ